MKVVKILIAVLVAGLLVATMVGCGSKTNAAVATQVATVKRGNLSQDITAAGNLALSKTQDLAVDLFYPNGVKGTIASVLVQLGDSVKAGQVLVTLDNDEWNDELDVLQQNLTTAQRNVTTKSISETDAERQLAVLQRQVTAAQKGVTTAQRTIESSNMAVTSAELAITSANNTLNAISDVKKAKDAIDEIKLKLRLAATGDSSYWSTQLANLQISLVQAQQYYNDIVTGSGVTSSTDVSLLIAQKYLAVQQAQFALVSAQNAVDDANLAVQTALQAVDDANYAVTKQQQTLANAKADLDTANNTLADTQKKLTDAKTKSPEIKAPFDGFVTKVSVSGGAEVLNGTVAVTVADPTKFEMNILVSEMDIVKVSIGGDATITLNSMPGVSLPAKITEIAPTATISSGVVNYSVTVNITSVPPVTSGSAPAATANATAQPGVPSGNFTARAGATPGSAGRSGQLPSTSTQNFQLKQGLTGTVDLIVAQSTNVLLVPTNAITKAGGQSSVQVVTGNNTTEKRSVQTGLNDWQNTEITSGLSEGEKIIVPKSTAPAATTTSQQRAPGIQQILR